MTAVLRCPVCGDPPAKRRVTCIRRDCGNTWRAHRVRVGKWKRRLEKMRWKYGASNPVCVWLTAYLDRPGVFTVAGRWPRMEEGC